MTARTLSPTLIGRCQALAAWAVDRGGFSVFAWARADVGGPVSVGDEVLDPDDEVFRLLAATLAV